MVGERTQDGNQAGGIQKLTPIRVPKVLAPALMKLAHKLDSGEAIDTDTKSKLGGNEHDTALKLPLSERVADSNWSGIDIDTKSNPGDIDNDTDSNQTDCRPEPGETNNDTDSSTPLFDSVTDSMLPLSTALVQATTVLKAKRSARASLAKLLSVLYHTQIRPDDLA